MAVATGRRVPLSVPRRWIDDLMAASRHVPVITFERRMELSAVAEARAALRPAPAWSLLFAKAFAIAAARRPELRRAYIPFPYPHLFEADETFCSLAVERDYHGEPAVFFALIRTPEKQTLPELMAHLARWQTQPVETIRDFRRMVEVSKLPRPVRRAVWWYGLNTSGARRARNFGTFGLSSTAMHGATALNLRSPLASAVNYGVLAADGSLPVRLHFDHRVYDGVPAAKALAEVEAALRGDVLAELRALAGTRFAPGVKAVDVVTAGGGKG